MRTTNAKHEIERLKKEITIQNAYIKYLEKKIERMTIDYNELKKITDVVVFHVKRSNKK